MSRLFFLQKRILDLFIRIHCDTSSILNDSGQSRNVSFEAEDKKVSIHETLKSGISMWYAPFDWTVHAIKHVPNPNL
jgi:hypothetical protein